MKIYDLDVAGMPEVKVLWTKYYILARLRRRSDFSFSVTEEIQNGNFRNVSCGLRVMIYKERLCLRRGAAWTGVGLGGVNTL